MKSTTDEIRRRFDADVERFSNLETGQRATVDAPLVLDLIATAAAAVSPEATHCLDVGCGAGNYSLKLLEVLPELEIDLIDLSAPMLARATERIARRTARPVNAYQTDIRDASLPEEHYHVIVAAAVLHHLRGDDEWERVFARLYGALAPGGCLWISDMVDHSIPGVRTLMWQRYGAYLEDFRGPDYRDHVLEYIEREDTPRTLSYQLDLLQTVGFRQIEVLHKNSIFAAFGGIK